MLSVFSAKFMSSRRALNQDNQLPRVFPWRRAQGEPADPLNEFPSEDAEPEPSVTEAPQSPPHRHRVILALIAAVAIIEACVLAWQGFGYLQAAPAPQDGTLSVQTEPAGALILVDGVARGSTPFTARLVARRYNVELRWGSETRSIPVEVTTGSTIAHHVDLHSRLADAGFVRLEFASRPAGAQISVDGAVRGTAPLAIEDLTPGRHEIVLTSADSSGGGRSGDGPGTAGPSLAITTVVAPTQARPAPAAGWLTVASPEVMQILQSGKLLGTSQSERIMMPAGRHRIEIVSEALDYREARMIEVVGGRTSTIRLDLPDSTIDINAVPWAEVWVDGRRVDETPIGKFPARIGTHEVVFRHPQLGERRQTVVVKRGTPARVSADLTR
jgi:hypothetical protein